MSLKPIDPPTKSAPAAAGRETKAADDTKKPEAS